MYICPLLQVMRCRLSFDKHLPLTWHFVMPIDIGIQCINAYPCNPRQNNKLIAILSNLIRFFVLILGAFTPPPQILEPVTNIPLKTMTKKFINTYHHFSNVHYCEQRSEPQVFCCWCRHTALNATIFKNLITPKAKWAIVRKQRPYHDAPTTDREIESPIPRDAHMKGEVWSKNLTRRGQFFQ